MVKNIGVKTFTTKAQRHEGRKFRNRPWAASPPRGALAARRLVILPCVSVPLWCALRAVRSGVLRGCYQSCAASMANPKRRDDVHTAPRA